MRVMAAGALQEFAVPGGHPFIVLLLRLDKTILGFNDHPSLREWQGLQTAAVVSTMIVAGDGEPTWLPPGPWHDSQPVYG